MKNNSSQPKSLTFPVQTEMSERVLLSMHSATSVSYLQYQNATPMLPAVNSVECSAKI